ncbi:hypothetical protein BJY01DRAFT_43869 [Aspergillus pseudoustus]|uniref:Uncharacterized protein n=1 Tax=Aspergillus pseudoustus TaxID=1810923 RepID=A0ABR4KPR7_9EURO
MFCVITQFFFTPVAHGLPLSIPPTTGCSASPGYSPIILILLKVLPGQLILLPAIVPHNLNNTNPSQFVLASGII